jgi:hypothetical protein
MPAVNDAIPRAGSRRGKVAESNPFGIYGVRDKIPEKYNIPLGVKAIWITCCDKVFKYFQGSDVRAETKHKLEFHADYNVAVKKYEWSIASGNVTIIAGGGDQDRWCRVESIDSTNTTFIVRCVVTDQYGDHTFEQEWTHRRKPVTNFVKIREIRVLEAGSCEHENGVNCTTEGRYEVIYYDEIGFEAITWIIVSGESAKITS